MASTVPVFVEIERLSNEKWEWNPETQTMQLDRTLPSPFKYPFAYGFIPDTLGGDGDALDALIISDHHPLLREMTYDVYIVGVLVMEDEQGRDDKMLCVLEKDWMNGVRDLLDIPHQSRYEIVNFFTHYKGHCDLKKWTKVYGMQERDEALCIYESAARYPPLPGAHELF